MVNTVTDRRIFSVLVVFIILLASHFSMAAAFADVVFIANTSVEASTLSKKEIKDIFLGDRVSWGNGQKIHPAVLKDLPVHKEFTRFYTHKTESQFLRFWKKQLFTGKAQIPDTFTSENDLTQFVENTKGAIGYLSFVPKLKGIKIITVSEQ